MKRVTHSFKSEAELCDAFATQARAEGFAVYPETSDWDLLLVDTDGAQCGVQAKLRANLDVLYQALSYGDPGESDMPGPDYHAVLVPDASSGFRHIAHLLNLACFDARQTGRPESWRTWTIRDELKRTPAWFHPSRCWTPPFEISHLGGGVPAPQSITPWKVGAVKLCALLRSRGHLTRQDFREAGIDINFWTQGRPVLLRSIPGEGRKRLYVATGDGQLPDEMYPDVAAALAAAAATASEVSP